MGAILDALAVKYSTEDPPLDYAAGIRQATELDPATNLGYADADEMDKNTRERLVYLEGQLMLQLNTGRFAFPLPDAFRAVAFPGYPDAQITSIVGFQLTTAAEALEKYMLGEMFLKASNRAPQVYMDRALFYLGDKRTGKPGDADLTLAKVVKSVVAMGTSPDEPVVRSRIIGVTTLSADLHTVRPEYFKPRFSYWGGLAIWTDGLDALYDSCYSDQPYAWVDYGRGTGSYSTYNGGYG